MANLLNNKFFVIFFAPFILGAITILSFAPYNLTFINSICALEYFKCSEEYKYSKKELLNYCRELSNELINKKIRINSILPGNIMHENSVWNKKFESKEGEVNFVNKTMPFNDWIYPEDVFNTIEFLIHNQNVVNTEIILDGGQSLISPN